MDFSENMEWGRYDAGLNLIKASSVEGGPVGSGPVGRRGRESQGSGAGRGRGRRAALLSMDDA